MNKENFKKALFEVEVILKDIIPEEQIEKIPKKLLNFINNNKNTDHVFVYDFSKEFEEQNMLKETKIFIGMLYLNYWADEDEKTEINKILDDNERKYIEELNNKYSVDNLFKNRNNKTEEIKENMNLPVEYHENLITKIIKFIKNIFKKG